MNDIIPFVNPYHEAMRLWNSGIGPREYGLAIAGRRKKNTPKQTNKKKNFKKH